MAEKTISHPELGVAPLLRVYLQWFWFRWVWQALTTQPGARMVPSDWYARQRGANYTEVWLGPVNILWRSKWLEGPARQLHPELFK